MLGLFFDDAPDVALGVFFVVVLRVLVFFFDGALADFFEVTVFFFDARFRTAVFFRLALERFFETPFEVFFFDAAVFFFDVRFFDTGVRRLLTAARFLRPAALCPVLRTDDFFDVFFLVAAFFAGIVGLQDRLKTRSAIIQMREWSGRPKIYFFSTWGRRQNDRGRGHPF